MGDAAEPDRPRGFAIPMAFPLAGLGLGALADIVLPDLGLPPAGRAAGWALVALGGAFALASTLWLHRAGGDAMPNRAAPRLVTGGVFAVSRNPIYLGAVCALLGAGLAADSLGILCSAPLAALALDRLVVLPEERHLGARFGADWEAYRARTRRWL